jgi:hypothetical protein
VLDGSVTRLRAHGTLEPTNHEARPLEPKGDEIQEIYKLAEDDALCRRVLHAEVAEFFHKRLDLRARAPSIKIKAANDTLPSDFRLLRFDGLCFKVDRKEDMTDRTVGLAISINIGS